MAMKLLSSQTAADAGSIAFTSSIAGFNSDYKLYIFKFIDMNPEDDSVDLLFNGSIDAGSNYNVSKTTSFFDARHNEADDSAALEYQAGRDLAEATTGHSITMQTGTGADESGAGTLWLFNPSNTTYVKHFYSRLSAVRATDASLDCFTGGYFNTTSDIDAVNFAFYSGNMNGTIKMYGVG